MSLDAENITVSFAVPTGGRRTVLDGCSLSVSPGEIVGLTGDSGTGKSTFGRVMAGLLAPDSGTVTCDDVKVAPVRTRAGKATRGRIGMLFQSPRRSCDPRLTLDRTIRGTAAAGMDCDALIREVAITPDLLSRHPWQVSDGQLQRAALARTLAARPRYLICDEMTAMLDAATTAAVVAVVRRFARDGGGVLFISHDHELLDAVTEHVVDLTALQKSHLD